jgi:3-isopropylmalate/(R)-2-methylmalate dehydratase small subunit
MSSVFTPLKSRCLPLNRNNIDTDQIIPARFLKGTKKTGLGQSLFHDWRYDGSGAPVADFPLNEQRFAGAKVLVAGHNFGCGSSREHAPWALKDYGFQAVIAVSFADIFKNNSLKNRLLPIALPERDVFALLGAVEADPTKEVAIWLDRQEVVLPDGAVLGFEIDPFRKTCLLEGVDDIGYTLRHLDKILAYEAAHV